MTGNPFAPPSAVVADVGSAQTLSSQPPFFAVSLLKLVVLSICTFGIYELYWFYKNWLLIKDREASAISPALRAVFAVFFCYQCLARIGDFATPALAKSRLAAGPLAVGWILTTLLNRLPGGTGWLRYWPLPSSFLCKAAPTKSTRRSVLATIRTAASLSGTGFSSFVA